MIEEWKLIDDFDGRYEISNLGRVKSLRNYCNSGEPWIMKQFMGSGASGEYLRIALMRPDGLGQRKLFVHRLVAKAFIPNPDNKPMVNHKNGIKNDNRVVNLEWCTHSENMQHAIKTGRKRGLAGEKNYQSRLSELQVIEIRRILERGEKSMYQIAKDFGVSKVTIFDIKYRNTWKHIPDGTTRDH